MSIFRAVSIWATAIAFLAFPLLAQQTRPVAPRVTEGIDETKLHTLPGDTHPLARPEFDRGTAPADLPMERMLLLLSRTPEQEAEIEQLIEQQQTPGSPNYHRWLTPEQCGERFGAAPEDIEQITRWLRGRGFRVDRIALGRGLMEFSGTAAQVTRAFHTEIHRYVVNGEAHLANAQEPRIPAALAPAIIGIVSLNDFTGKVLHHSRGTARRDSAGQRWIPAADRAEFTYQTGGSTLHLLSPYDFATIYNVLPLWTAGLDGAGQTIAIAGRSNIWLQDVRNFRSLFGLPARDPVVTLNGPDPGTTNRDEEMENVLDVEWAGAVARSATINLVVSETTAATSGDSLSAEYIVDHNLAPVLSASYGYCEPGSPTRNKFYRSLWQQAAAQGITVVVAAGDSGSAVCDQGGEYAQSGLAVNGMASTPYNVAVGGTDFSDGASNSEGAYWNATNASGTNASAQSYIPEMTWNETCASPVISGFLDWSTPEALCNYSKYPFLPLLAGSGGASAAYPKPSWQGGLWGVPGDGKRDLPDVSLFAATGSFWDTAYAVCQADQSDTCDPGNGTRVAMGGGDSFGAPAFAAIMALINQKTGSRQGLANPALYLLASLEYGTPGNPNSAGSMECASGTTFAPGNHCVFYDVINGTNDVPCLKGTPDCTVSQPSDSYGLLSSGNFPAFSATVGYDLATGLGSVNVTNLVNAWPQPLCCNQPLLLVNLAHAGNFAEAGEYTVTVANDGSGPTVGTVTVIDTPPASLTGVYMSGPGWNCAGSSCSRSDVLNPGASYPPIGVSVHVLDAPSQLVNQVTVSGGGSPPATASDPTTTFINHDFLTISKTHTGNFSQGQTGATYTLIVTNKGAVAAANGVTKVIENLPAGLTLSWMSGAGWTCTGAECTRMDVLGPRGSFPAITVTVNVASTAPAQVTNQAAVSFSPNIGGTGVSDITSIRPVGANSTTTILAANPGTIKASESVMLTAMVTGVRSGSGIPTGIATFNLGSTLLGSAEFSGAPSTPGAAQTTLLISGSQLAVGSNSITTTYNGDAVYSPSTSAPVVVTVTAVPVSGYTIDTMAGSGTAGFSGDSGPAPWADLNKPAAVAATAGIALIADEGNNRIRIADDRKIGTLAGDGTQGFGGDGGLPFLASLNQPRYVARGATGDIFIADQGNHRIRRLSSLGGIDTVAGDGTKGFSGDGGRAVAAELDTPAAVAVDGAGNLFIADSGNYRIRKVTAAGVISTIAGNGTSGFSGDGGQAISAALGLPSAVAVDGSGNLFIADSANHRIRKVTAAGIISTVVGSGATGVIGGGFSGDGRLATLALLNQPLDVAVDAAGNLFIADSGNSQIRMVDHAGTITTVAGNGDSRFSGDGGPATWAALNHPTGVAVDSSGTVLVADSGNNRIRRLTPPSSPPPSLTISKTHSGSFSQDQTGAQYTITVSNRASGSATDGPVTVTENVPTGLIPGSMTGDGWTCSAVTCTRYDTLPPGSSYPVITVTMNVASDAPSQLTNQATVSGGNSAPATANDVTSIIASPVPTITTLAADPSTITAAGSTTLTATVTALACGPGGTPIGNVSFNWGNTLLGAAPLAAKPGSVAQATLVVNGSQLAAGSNNITASYGGNTICASSVSGPTKVSVIQPGPVSYTIETAAGNGTSGFSGDAGPAISAALSMPGAVAADGTGNLFVVDWGNSRVRRVTRAGTIDTVAGSGTSDFSGDGGQAISAALNQPSRAVVDAAGNLYIADQANNRIRKVTTAGMITTVAGSGTRGFSGDGGLAISAALSQPSGVAVDSAGSVFIADYGNHRIRKVSSTGTITTIAGNGTAGLRGDGGQATLAGLNLPASVAVDASGNLLIADYGNNRIRKVTADGTISTVAGSGAEGLSGGGFSGDGGLATQAMLNGPSDLAVDPAGNLFIADSFNSRVRMVDTSGTITTVAGNGTWGFAGDGGPAISAEFGLANGIAVDSSGDIFIADLGNNRIRKLTPVVGPQIGMVGSTPSVFNAATFQTGGIAPNEFISLKGTGLGPAAGAISAGMSAQLGGSSVSIGGMPAYLTYAQDGQINALVPFHVSGSQSTTIQVTYNGVAGNSLTVPVVASSPGIFTQSYGPGQVWMVDQDGTFNSPTNAAPRGTYVAFWVTGQGLVNTTLADGSQPGGPSFPTPTLPLNVSLGGVPVPAANIVFDGLIYSGEVQVNLLIPVNAPTGNAVPLVVTLGGASSRADATIAIQ